MKFLNGIVSHSRVGDQKHAFDYGYKSLLVEDIFDFETNLFKSIFISELFFIKEELACGITEGCSNLSFSIKCL